MYHSDYWGLYQNSQNNLLAEIVSNDIWGHNLLGSPSIMLKAKN